MTRTNEMNYTIVLKSPSFKPKRSGNCFGYVIIQKTSAGSGRMTLEGFPNCLLFSLKSLFFFRKYTHYICEATKMSKAIISPSVLAVSTRLRIPKDMDSCARRRTDR